jgi:glycerophosphoryl diester phosphodiesterase
MRVSAPEILAHRAGPLRAGVPWQAEQTLPAFTETWVRERIGCELDVRFTSDGVPVVFHDATLERMTGRRGRIDEITLSEFQVLRADIIGADPFVAQADQPVPLATLDEVLRFAARTGAHLDVELKNLPGEPAFDPTARTAEALATRLCTAGMPMHRLTVQSFWPDDVAALISRLPGVRSSLLVAPGVAEVGVETALAISADAVGLAWPVDTEVIRAARERGLFVMTYTVNDAKAMRAAAQAGVDAIITDDPTVARLCLATPPVLAGG